MFLSKSDYMTAYNCVKALWLKKNRKDLIPIINEAQQTSFDIGNEVQELARQYFDNGIMVNAEPWDVINGVILTKNWRKIILFYMKPLLNYHGVHFAE